MEPIEKLGGRPFHQFKTADGLVFHRGPIRFIDLLLAENLHFSIKLGSPIVRWQGPGTDECPYAYTAEPSRIIPIIHQISPNFAKISEIFDRAGRNTTFKP
jgi:hypothetical protein